jgi:hypothetical protein
MTDGFTTMDHEGRSHHMVPCTFHSTTVFADQSTHAKVEHRGNGLANNIRSSLDLGRRRPCSSFSQLVSEIFVYGCGRLIKGITELRVVTLENTMLDNTLA